MQPILVTGSHRSGTTWVGRMLAKAPGVAYISEPFHPGHDRGICAAEFEGYYTHITDENGSRWHSDIANTVNFFYAFAKRLSQVSPTFGGFLGAVRDCLFYDSNRWRRKRPLIKDPIALLAAPWLARHFNMRVVVLIRHPAAFVASIKRLGWTFSFRDWLTQKQLMHEFFRPFNSQIEELARRNSDPVEQAILVWKCLYHVVNLFQQQYGDWIFLRHEDISSDPVGQFRRLYNSLDLKFTAKAHRAILAATHSENPLPSIEFPHEIHINSQASLNRWLKELSNTEIQQIYRGTYPVSRHWYDDSDWPCEILEKVPMEISDSVE